MLHKLLYVFNNVNFTNSTTLISNLITGVIGKDGDPGEEGVPGHSSK